jgi:hypothetical protein
LGNRAQVEELARLLEGGVSASGSVSAPHVLLAMRLREVGTVLHTAQDSRFAPSADFRARLRTRLVAVAQVQAAAAADLPFAEPVARAKPLEAVAAWTQTRRAQRRIGVTAGAMAGVIAFTGVGIAASRSLPGQPFYSLKRGAEAVQLGLASGDQAKGTKHLEFAATRLREVSALASGEDQLALGAPAPAVAAGVALGGSLQKRINDTLADFNAETSSGRMLLEGVYRKTGKQEPLRILKTFSAEQGSKLTALLPQLPTESQAVAQSSLDLVKDVQSTVTEQLALSICGGECFPGNAGPTLPAEPVPSPGVTASPTPSDDDNGVAPCTCGPTPEPTPTNGSSETPTPTSSPTATPSSSPTPTPSQSPGPLPTLLPTLIPALPVGGNLTADSTGPLPAVGKLP